MQGVLAAVAYVVLGVPFVLVLASITALFSLLPIGGTALVGYRLPDTSFGQDQSGRPLQWPPGVASWS
jgi:hypothetical protein